MIIRFSLKYKDYITTFDETHTATLINTIRCLEIYIDGRLRPCIIRGSIELRISIGAIALFFSKLMFALDQVAALHLSCTTADCRTSFDSVESVRKSLNCTSVVSVVSVVCFLSNMKTRR